MFTSLWTIGIVLFRHRHQSQLTLWVSGFMLIGGCGSFAVTVMTWFIRYAEAGSFAHALLRNTAIASITVYFTLLCYMFLIISIVSGSYLKNKAAFRMTALALLAFPVSWVVRHVEFGTPAILDISGLRLWAGLYVLAGSCLFVTSWIREPNRYNRQNRLRLALFFITALAWAYGTDHLGTQKIVIDQTFVTEGSAYWKINYLIVLFVVASFLSYGVRYGFLGVKLRIDRQKHEYSMRALMAGSQVLHHSIRNEIQKIHYLNERAKHRLDDGQGEEALAAMDDAETVMERLMDRIYRLKRKSDDVTIREQTVRLSEYVESLIEPFRTEGRKLGIEVTSEVAVDGELTCDPELLGEALESLLSNAMEAVKPGLGTIRLTVRKSLGSLTFRIEDNGCGIDKGDHERVFEPFFTTKPMPVYYGLGLSYASHIVQKHGGMIRLKASMPGKGTAIAFRLPGKRFKEV